MVKRTSDVNWPSGCEFTQYTQTTAAPAPHLVDIRPPGLIACCATDTRRWTTSPRGPSNDHQTLSKGHVSPLHYAMLQVAAAIIDSEFGRPGCHRYPCRLGVGVLPPGRVAANLVHCREEAHGR